MQQEEFLNKVQDYGRLDSRDEAWRMTKIFLGTLGEWLYRTEAHNLEAQLPKAFAGLLFQEKNPEEIKGDTIRYPVEDFYNRIKGRADLTFREATEMAKAVARVLEEAVSPGQMKDVVAELPDGFDELFTATSS